jgi:hypothetical protein
VLGFGRTIALRRFIAVQQFRVGFETEFAAATMSAIAQLFQSPRLPGFIKMEAHADSFDELVESSVDGRE